METAFDYQLKVKTIENIVNEYNQVNHGTYRFQGDETMGWAEVISDTTSFSGCLLSKIAFAGHSQGGVIAGMLAGELEGSDDKPVCLLQLAPAAVLKDDALAGQCMNARYDAANPPAYVNVFFHKLGRDFILAAQKLPIYETSCRYSGKVCLIHGTKDAIVPVSYSEKYDQGYPDSELHLLEGEGHFMRSKKVLALSCRFLKEQLL